MEYNLWNADVEVGLDNGSRQWAADVDVMVKFSVMWMHAYNLGPVMFLDGSP